ncbi:acylneuraminate cytidylyltransferase family protein [Candidatus Parcubacteria bacterium]|nr:MAG: acylneuraminate cytidylyltransferase family protein [Candidatus Parcubacteria bacterium]
MSVLGLIPARAGSKSIPRKNVRRLAGYPLIAYSVAIAKISKSIGRVIVSTDEKYIADIAKDYGAEVPFLRPGELAEDTTQDLPVFQHALKWLQENESYCPEIIVHLRPTNPFRCAADIDSAVEVLREHPTAHSVRGVSLPLTSPYKMYRIKDDRFIEPLFIKEHPEAHNMPRQELPIVYRGNGAIDVVRRDTIMGLNSMTGYNILPWIIDVDRCVDIDTPDDWDYAEWLVEIKGRKLPPIASDPCSFS